MRPVRRCFFSFTARKSVHSSAPLFSFCSFLLPTFFVSLLLSLSLSLVISSCVTPSSCFLCSPFSLLDNFYSSPSSPDPLKLEKEKEEGKASFEYEKSFLSIHFIRWRDSRKSEKKEHAEWEKDNFFGAFLLSAWISLVFSNYILLPTILHCPFFFLKNIFCFLPDFRAWSLGATK